MARIRSIKPTIWTDQRFIALSRDARLLCVGMISQADDEGRLFASAARLLGDVFPADNLKPSQVLAWRDEIASSGIIRVYKVGAVEYAVFPNWLKHQRISKAQDSTLPPPPPVEPVAGDSATSNGKAAEPVAGQSRPRARGIGLETGDRRQDSGKPGTAVAVAGNDADASTVVKAYVDGAVSAGLPRPAEDLRGKVGKEAKRLLTKHEAPVDTLIVAARSMGSRGWDSLSREIQRVAATNTKTSTTDQRVGAALELAARLEAEGR